MSHTDMIWIASTAGIASTLGVFVVIRKVIQYTRPLVNVLVRRGDIELDYIEPARPEQIYPQLNLLEGQPMQWYIYEPAPSYHSDIRALYQSREVSINSCLENGINLDYIIIILIDIIIFIILLNIPYILKLSYDI